MQKQTMMKMTAAVALLFAVNINADAQFGKLLKKAKEAVTDKVGTSTSTDNPISNVVEEETSTAPGAPANESNANQKIDRQWFKENSTAQGYEGFCVNEDGGMQQYLGMTEGDEALVWKYYEKYKSLPADPKKNECGKTFGNELAEKLVAIKRMIKIADYKVDKKIYLQDMRLDHYAISGFYYDRTWTDSNGKQTMKAGKNSLMERALGSNKSAKGVQVIPMKKEDSEAFKRVLDKYKAEYEAIYGPIPQP